METSKFIFSLLAGILIASVAAYPAEDDRIVNGMSINIKNAPYMVRLVHSSGKYCGGSLIAPDYVLTAAHCVYNLTMEGFTTVANVTTIYERGLRRSVVRMTIHPEYNPTDMHSDVAVLQLNKPYENIPTIELCKQPLRENDTLQVSGWGAVADKQGGTVDLRTTFVPVRSKAVCDVEYHRFVKKNMFCVAGLQNTGSCRGDSGGPAVYKGQVCGLVAFSWKCGEVGSTEALTDVYQLRAFINNFMWLNWA